MVYEGRNFTDDMRRCDGRVPTYVRALESMFTEEDTKDLERTLPV